MKGSRKKIIRFAIAGVVIAFGVWLYRWSAIPDYEVIDLGSRDKSYTFVGALNNHGQVVGGADFTENKQHAFLWGTKDGIRDLGTLGGATSCALNLNDKGQVVGVSATTEGQRHAFFWDSNSGMVDLGTLGGTISLAGSVNNNGQVVGYAKTREEENHAFVWDTNSGMRDIGTLYGGKSEAGAINEKGQVVGCTRAPNGVDHAFYWDEFVGMIDIVGPNGPESYASGINDQGEVVGGVFEPKINAFTLFSWNKDSDLKKMRLSDIGWYPVRINNSGQIIGYVETAKFLFFKAKAYCFLRTQSGRVINLNKYAESEYHKISATDINNAGWILGSVEYRYNHRPILLRPK